MKLNDIVIGHRYRKELGDIQALADSIDARGLLHPPVITTDRQLVAGFRRIKAAELLGWEDIEVRVVDPDDLVMAERDENDCREDFTPSERVAIAREIERRIGNRRGQRTDKAELPGNCREVEPGEETKEAAARGAGFKSEGEYRRASTVVDHGVEELVEAVDAGDVSVSAAAEVAKLPKAEQKAAVKAGPKAVKEKAKQQREGKKKDATSRTTQVSGRTHPSGNASDVQKDTGEQAEPEPPAKPSKPAPTVDAWGIPVQPHAVEAFAAVPKFRELVGALKQAQRLFNALAGSPGGQFLTLPEVSSAKRAKGDGGTRFVHNGLDTCLKQVEAMAPTHTVCPLNYVDAPHPTDCSTCHGLNWTPVLGSNVTKLAEQRVKEVFGV